MVFWDITFPCSCTGFTKIPLTILSSLAVLTRYSETLKCSARYRRGPWIWCKCQNLYLFRVRSGSQLLFHQIVQTIKLWCLLFSFRITLTDSELASWSVLTTYASHDVFSTSTALSNLFFAVEAWLCWTTLCKWTGEIPIVSRLVLSFFFGISQEYSLSDSFCSTSDSFRSPSMILSHFLTHWKQRKCPGITVTFCFEFFCHQEGNLFFTLHSVLMWSKYSTVVFSSSLKHISKQLLMMKINCSLSFMT